MKGDRFNMKAKRAAYLAGRAQLMQVAANTAKNFFQVDNFDAEGFIDGSVQKWKKRKKETKRSAGKRLLVDTGLGRKSIRIAQVTANKAVIEVGAKYMGYHNRGEGKLPKRQFMGKSRTMTAKIEKIIHDYMKAL